jgi:hypothetical protein
MEKEKVKLSLNLARVGLYSDADLRQFRDSNSNTLLTDAQIKDRIGTPTREAVAALQIPGATVTASEENVGVIRIECGAGETRGEVMRVLDTLRAGANPQWLVEISL